MAMHLSSWTTVLEELSNDYENNERLFPGTQDSKSHEKTPEMNELEADTNSLKIWAHNSEKHKSYSIFQIMVFLASQLLFAT